MHIEAGFGFLCRSVCRQGGPAGVIGTHHWLLAPRDGGSDMEQHSELNKYSGGGAGSPGRAPALLCPAHS